jgi:Tryptophan-associated transmembrane protein (Trp_oprn_chp)
MTAGPDDGNTNLDADSAREKAGAAENGGVLSPGRARLVSLALCVIGAAVVWFGAGDPVPAATRAVSLVVLAGAGALLAARGLWRRLVAIAVLLAGLGLVAGGTTIAVGGAIMVAAGGLLAFLTANAWPAMGGRYERATPAQTGTTDLWTALDRGEDPTAR